MVTYGGFYTPFSAYGGGQQAQSLSSAPPAQQGFGGGGTASAAETAGASGAMGLAGLVGAIPGMISERHIRRKSKKQQAIYSEDMARRYRQRLAELAAMEQELKEGTFGKELYGVGSERGIPEGGIAADVAAEDIARLGTRSATPYQANQARIQEGFKRRRAAILRARLGEHAGERARLTYDRVGEALEETKRKAKRTQDWINLGLSAVQTGAILL